MASVERIVPIAKVSDIRVALEFYCSVLGFNRDFHYRAGPEGPDCVGPVFQWTPAASLQRSPVTARGLPRPMSMSITSISSMQDFAREDCRRTANRSIKHGASVRCTSETTTATRFGSAADYLKLTNTGWSRRRVAPRLSPRR